jgi:hypothetical protein
MCSGAFSPWILLKEATFVAIIFFGLSILGCGAIVHPILTILIKGESFLASLLEGLWHHSQIFPQH